jgi:hypothetical protein
VTVLALATLGGEIKNRNDPISLAQPKVAKASTIGIVVYCYRRHFRLKNIAYVHEP